MILFTGGVLGMIVWLGAGEGMEKCRAIFGVCVFVGVLWLVK